MRTPTMLMRIAAAAHVFRYGYPANGAVQRSTKELPWAWPSWKRGKPEWQLIDYRAYVDEGFNRNSLIFSAISYKARAMVTAPLRAYTGDPEYPELLDKKHPLAKLVSRPNAHQSWEEFQCLNDVYLNLAGNSYSYKARLSAGKRELWPLRPDRVFVVPTAGPRAGISHYLYVPEGEPVEKGLPLLVEDVIHVKLPNPGDPLEGMGYGLAPMSPAAQSGDTDNMVTEFLNIFFQQGAMLTGILSFDIPLREGVVDIVLDRWKKKYGGFKKWSVGVLDRGGKYQRLSLTFEEMGFKELDARNECRILGPFGVPPQLIGARVGMEGSNYSNDESARKRCWEDTLVPEMRLFEVEFQHHLKARNAFVKFDMSAVPALQKDLPVLVTAAYTMWQMGVPANQAFAAVGMKIGDVPGGDIPHVVGENQAGQDQGPRADTDDGWGMRALVCDQCGSKVARLEAGMLFCEPCNMIYSLVKSGNGGGNGVKVV